MAVGLKEGTSGGAQLVPDCSSSTLVRSLRRKARLLRVKPELDKAVVRKDWKTKFREESAMAGEQQGDQQAVGPPVAGWRSTVEEQYRKIKENAETYPYVWASYIVVYGGFGLWMAYRWRKLWRTEDRVRVLQERLRELVRAEESAAASASSSSAAAEKAT
ncbi:hypothetical protein CRG98_043422 [Punica granatum]|uniref:Uncharacterized protein n=1 Tax=Punica granatum TaxID=22663 RepID=A0A2I0HWU0_PUNGR|nr:hypothetical protein CRG98_043422 [Punica granatum]